MQTHALIQLVVLISGERSNEKQNLSSVDESGVVSCVFGATGILETLGRNAERVVRRWTSTYTNARLEGLNSLFQAARARARGYRNNDTFIAMIYMIASPAGSILKST